MTARQLGQVGSRKLLSEPANQRRKLANRQIVSGEVLAQRTQVNYYL